MTSSHVRIASRVLLSMVSLLAMRAQFPSHAQERPIDRRQGADRQEQSRSSPLDALDARQIAPEDRAQGLPPELVAILGSNRGRHSEAAKCVAVSPNGRIVASGSRDRSVRLWDPTTLQERRVLPHPDDVDVVCFSADSTRLFSVCWDGNLRVWDLEQKDEEPFATIPLAKKQTACVINAMTRTVIASAEAQGRSVLRILKLDGEDATVSHQDLDAGDDFDGCLTFSSDGRWVAADCDEIRIWHLERADADPVWTISNVKSVARSLVFTGDGRFLLAGCKDGAIVIWRLTDDSPRQVAKLTGHTSEVVAMAFSPDGKQLVSGGYDREVIVWNWRDGEPERAGKLSGHSDWVGGLAFAPDGETLYSAGWDHTVRRWAKSAGSFEPKPQITGHSQAVTSIAFSADGALVATGATSAIAVPANPANEVRIWELGFPQPKAQKVLANCVGWIHGVAFSHDRRILAAADNSGIVYWKLDDRAVAERFKHTVRPYGDDFDSPAESVAFAPNRRALASGWMYPHLRISNFDALPATTVDSWEPPNHHIEALTFSPDGKTLVAASTNLDAVFVLDVDPLRLRRQLALEPTQTGLDRVECLAFSPDGRHIAAGSRSGDVDLWELHSDAEPTVVRGHDSVVSSVCFGGGNILASSDWNGHVVLWDVKAGESKTVWQFPGRIWRMAFAPDGRHLAVGGGTGVVYLLRLKVD